LEESKKLPKKTRKKYYSQNSAHQAGERDSIISSLVFCAKSRGKASISDFAQDIAFNPHICLKKTLSNHTLKLSAKYFDLSKNVLIWIFHFWQWQKIKRSRNQ
jgi:hypothetical protein